MTCPDLVTDRTAPAWLALVVIWMSPPGMLCWIVIIQDLFPRWESLYRAYRAANSQVTNSCMAGI